MFKLICKGGEKIRKQTITKIIIPLIFVSIAIICMGNATAAPGDTIYVNGSSGNDSWTGYSWDQPKLTIKNATESVNDGGIINIANGQYTGVGNTDITINKNMTINGQNQTETIINGNGNNQIFRIQSELNVTLQNIMLINSKAEQGGAIYNNGDLTVNNCSFIANKATESEDQCAGGAIYNNGSLTINNCNFTGNMANDTNNGEGGAIYNNYQCNMTVNNSNFNNNTASVGGGAINHVGNDLKVTNCKFTSNKAAEGGAIDTYSGPDVSATIKDSIFTSNTAFTDTSNGHGGAIFNTSSYEIIGCTFENNSANTGGALSHLEIGTDLINNCTFIDNYTDIKAAAIINGEGCIMTINNSIFNGNTGPCIIDNEVGILNITGSNFYNNIATEDGVIQTTSDTIVKYSRFVGNSLIDIYQLPMDYPQTIDVRYNWWGSNNGPAQGKVVGKDVTFNPWLVLNITSNPSTIYVGGTSKITTDVYQDSTGTNHSNEFDQFFSGPEIEFSTNLGNMGSKSITLLWTFGSASTTLKADEGQGIAIITAKDVQTVQTTVKILPRNPHKPVVKINASSVDMQNTGIPLPLLCLAILMIFGGIIGERRK